MPLRVLEGLRGSGTNPKAQRHTGVCGRQDPLLAQSIIVFNEEERKHLTSKEALPFRPQRSGQLLTHLTSSPWPRRLGSMWSDNAVAQLPSLLTGAVRAAPGLGEDGALLNVVFAVEAMSHEWCSLEHP